MENREKTLTMSSLSWRRCSSFRSLQERGRTLSWEGKDSLLGKAGAGRGSQWLWGVGNGPRREICVDKVRGSSWEWRTLGAVGQRGPRGQTIVWRVRRGAVWQAGDMGAECLAENPSLSGLERGRVVLLAP